MAQPPEQRTEEPPALLTGEQLQSAHPSRQNLTRRVEDALKRFRRQERYITAGTIGIVVAALVSGAFIVILVITLLPMHKISPPSPEERAIALTVAASQSTPMASLGSPSALASSTPNGLTGTPSGTVTSSPTPNGSPTVTSAPTPTVTTPSMNSATFLRADTTHQGTWIGSYGQGGADVIDNGSTIPSAIQISFTGASTLIWSNPTTDQRGLQTLSGSSRVAAGLDATTNFTIDINITDGKTHQLALYVLDWDDRDRAEQIVMLNVATNAVLDTESAAEFDQGEYLVWNVHGHIIVSITHTAGLNAVVSGVFFG